MKSTFVVNRPMACLRWDDLYNRRPNALIIELCKLVIAELRYLNCLIVQPRKEYPGNVTMLNRTQTTVGDVMEWYIFFLALLIRNYSAKHDSGLRLKMYKH